MQRLDTDLAIASVLFLVFATMVAIAANYPPEARFVPLAVGIPAMLLSGWQVSREVRRCRLGVKGPRPAEGGNQGPSSDGIAVAWLFLFILMTLVGGFVVGGTLAVMASQRFWLRESWRTTGWGGVVAFVVLYFCFEQGLGQPLFDGWLAEWIR